MSLVLDTPDPCSSEYDKATEQATSDHQLLQMLEDLEDPSFDQVIEIASIICEAPVALISLVGRDRQWVKSKKGIKENERSPDLSICKDAFLEPGLFIVPDTTRDSRFADTPVVDGASHLRFYAGVQLKSQQGHRLGTLCVLDHRPRELDESQCFVLQTLANQVVRNLEMKLAHHKQVQVIRDLKLSQHELSKQVATDPMTNLLNRRGFEQRLNQELALIKRGAPSSALLLIDIDHFKVVNDRLGHKAGDQVLLRFSELCRHVFREADVICRWGGEEFLVMLPRATVVEAEHAAKRLNDLLAITPMADGISSPLFITVSIGINALTVSSTTDSFLRRADELLYQAKEQGRNRIVCDPPLERVAPIPIRDSHEA